MNEITFRQIISIDKMPEGELRISRKRWPKNSSPLIIHIVYHGEVFTVAKACIAIGSHTIYEAEGVSRLSPLDDPNNPGRDKAWRPILKKRKLKEIPEAKVDPMISYERAIKQAVEALHTRVTKRRRSYHHYRG